MNTAVRKKPATMAAKRAATEAATKARQTRLPIALNIDTDGDGIRLLSKLEVVDRVGASYPSIWQWMRAGTFPRSRSLGGKTVWIAAEVEAWICSLPASRLKGDDEAVA